MRFEENLACEAEAGTRCGVPGLATTMMKLQIPGRDCTAVFKTVLLLAGLALPGIGLAGHDLPSPKHANPRVGPPPAKTVKVTTRREGAVTHFYVENTEFCEITMTFEMALVNLKGEAPFPRTLTFPARRVTEAFSLSPLKAGQPWEYSYTNFFKLGSNCVRHNEASVYLLPYAPGAEYKVTQGFNGSFSHTGANQYAIDWKMPEGTPVRAARGGAVVRVKDDSNTGGSSMKYDPCNNYVLIRHDNGTLGHYCHLQKGGCVVKPGQTVAAGQIIARSGNTGFSSGPHLHFCVYRTKDGRQRESIPIKFRTEEGLVVTPIEGHSYRAAPIQSASAFPPGSLQPTWQTAMAR